jgi:hypothetical protein
MHTFMLITFFPRLWHGNCTAFNAAGHGRGRSPAREIAEYAEKGGDWGKATANGTAFTAENAEDAENGGNGGNGETTRNPELPSTPCAVDLGLGTLDCGYAARLRPTATPWQAGGKAGSGGRKCLSPEIPGGFNAEIAEKAEGG